MDYKFLLQKYITAVIAIEDHSFVSDIEGGFRRDRRSFTNHFSDEEMIALRSLENLAEIDVYDKVIRNVDRLGK